MELNEGVIENMVAKSIEGLLLETMSTDEIYAKYYSNIDKSVFDAAVKADPTSDADHAGRYVKWILGLYKKGNWKPGDSYETKDALSKFHRLRNNLEIKDINGYKSVRQLLDAVSDKQSARDVKKSGAEKVYEDDEWLVIVPHTEEASKLYGKGTRWCTAADNDNYFDYYNNQGPLYINIRKRDGKKWQFHFESGSFMDAEDDPVRIKDIGLSDGLVKFYEKVCPYFKAFFEYDHVGDFNEGFAAVDVDGKCNFIDKEGNLLSPGQWFDGCYPFYEGFARVILDDMCNFIDPNGNILSQNQWFDGCGVFKGGFAKVRLDWKWNFIDTEGNILSPDQWFNGCGYFREGFGRVILDNMCNFIDPNGNILSPGQWFHSVCGFNEGFALVEVDGKWYYIDTEGNLYDENKNLIKRNNRSNDSLINEALSVNDVYSIYYSDIDKSVFDAAVKSDPTSDADHAGRYVKWILGLYKNGNWKPGDSYETKDALSKFHRLRNSLEIKDINGYKSVRQLLDAVSDKQSARDVKKSGAEKVYEDDEWLVVVPHTEEASKLYGKGTRWCTAADNDNYFDYYNKQGPLYINIRKMDGEKWQFHFESRSFMDAEDDPVRIKDIGLSDGLVRFYEKVCPYFKAFFEYDHVGDFNEGLARVKLDGKWNFIDIEGNVLSPGQWFDFCGGFYEGLARVKLDGKWNYIDTKGNLVSADQWFDYAYNFREGFADVELNGKWNYLDSKGNILLPGQWFDDVSGFNEGFAVIRLDRKYNFINTEGNILLPGQWFDDVSGFNEGFAVIRLDRKYNFINTEGNILLPGQWFDDVSGFNEGFARVKFDGRWYYIDREGNLYDESRNLVRRNKIADANNLKESKPNIKVIVNEEQRWHIVCESLSANEIRDKYYQDVPNFTFTLAMKADPTSKPGHPGRYVKWILNLWRNKSWMPIEWERTNMVLKRFEKAKPHMDEQDINRYKSMDELEDAIDSVDVPDSSTDIKNKGSEKVYEDDKWLVIRIDTWEASKLYGAGTKWCTSEDKPDAFDAYNSNGKLYLNIRKTDKSKFLLFLSNSGYGTEFKDATNHDTSFGDIDATKGLVEFYRAMDWKPDTAAKRAGLMESSKAIRNIILTEEQGWRLLCESMSIQDVHDKYYPDIDMDVFKAAVMADPTSSNEKAGRYVKWILGLYKKGNWKPGDSYETKDALSRFHRLRNSLEIKDINGYKSVRQLLDAVSDKQSARDVKKSGAEKVYEDGEWMVIVPHTEEASKLYGKGTKWCTAADNDNYFDYYNNQGPLYINIRKRDGEKWQFHFESGSFMNSEDDPVRIEDIGLSDGLVRFYEKVCPYFRALLEYDYVGSSHEGFTDVKLNGRWNFVDIEGNILSPDQWFDDTYPFQGDFARVNVNMKWNFIDKEGNILSPGQWFDWCDDFHGGFARVGLDNNENIIDTNGNILSPEQWFDWCGIFYEGFATIELGNKDNFIDTNGNILSPGQWFDRCDMFYEGFAEVKLDEKYNFVDTNGNLLSPGQWFDDAFGFYEGFARVELDGKWYYIDRDGNLYDKYKNKILDNRSNSD